MFIIDIESNTSVGGLTLDPAGMHCPSWDDAFVSRNKSIVPRRTMHAGRMSGHFTKKGFNYYVNNYNA